MLISGFCLAPCSGPLGTGRLGSRQPQDQRTRGVRKTYIILGYHQTTSRPEAPFTGADLTRILPQTLTNNKIVAEMRAAVEAVQFAHS